ncbi:MAG: co-chaperone GroES [Rikenellaceae bacterium]
MKIKPLFDGVLVKVQEGESKTDSGLFIPQESKAGAIPATVEEVGEGTEEQPMRVTVGDEVILSKNFRNYAEDLGDGQYIVKQNSILAIVND